MDVFGEVSVDYEKPSICHCFYSDNDDSLIDATLDLESGEVVYLRESYALDEHQDFLGSFEEALEEDVNKDNSYDFEEEVNNYAGY